MLCISSKLIGQRDNKHLLLLDEKSMQWVERCPPEAYYFSGEIKPKRKCFDTLLSLSCLAVDVKPPSNFVKMMSQLTKSARIPWQLVMPPSEYSGFVKTVSMAALDAYGKSVRPYYEGTWTHGNVVLDALQPACIDKQFFDELLETEAHVSTALKSFEPDIDGFSKKPVYNRLGTRTGRMTHATGPDYLTLKKRYRKLIKSRFGDDGEIIYIDFSAMEVRVLFYDAQVSLAENDVYQKMSADYFSGSISREALKLAVISCIYDQTDIMLSGVLGLDLLETRKFMHFINKLAQKDKLLSKLKQEYIASQTYISNKYGRRVVIKEPLDRMFINSYAQSTAVDVALMGFSQITQELCDDNCVPLGIIHDGMLFDCNKSVKHKFPKFIRQMVDGFDQPFVLKSEIL